MCFKYFKLNHHWQAVKSVNEVDIKMRLASKVSQYHFTSVQIKALKLNEVCRDNPAITT